MTKYRGVQSGTRSGPFLCDTCRYSQVTRGEQENQEDYHCSQFDKPILYKIVECSKYLLRGSMALYEMNDIAFVLEQKKGKVGFVSPKDRDNKNDLRELF